MFSRRRVTHYTSVRRRPEAFDAYRRVQSRRYYRFAHIVAAILRTQPLTLARRETFTRVLRVVRVRYLDLTRFLRHPESLVDRSRPPRTIADIPDDDYAKRYYGFKKNDLFRVLNALDLPNPVVVLSGDRTHRFEAHEVLLVFLQRYRMSTAFEAIADAYGRDASQWQRAFKWMVRFIVENHGHLLTDNLSYFTPSFPAFARAIHRRCTAIMDARVDTIIPAAYFDREAFLIAGFIDCNVTRTQVPGAGPIAAGPNAPRRESAFEIQRAFYSGYTHIHGLKRELILFPNGMFGYCSPTFRAGTNDRRITAQTEIAAKLEDAQAEHNFDSPYCVYGDGLYVACRTVRRPHFPRNHITPQEKSENDVMKRVRVSIENAFGAYNKTFPFASHARNVRILNPLNQDYSLVGYFLWNVHVCLNHSAINLYYDFVPPNLEHWIDS